MRFAVTVSRACPNIADRSNEQGCGYENVHSHADQ